MKDDPESIVTILRFCGSIRTTMDHFGYDEEDFLENEIYQNSCCFAIEQIGEAVKRMPFFITNAHPEVEWSKIAKMRDFIAHSYWKADMYKLWVTLNREIPELESKCASILEKLRKEDRD